MPCRGNHGNIAFLRRNHGDIALLKMTATNDGEKIYVPLRKRGDVVNPLKKAMSLVSPFENINIACRILRCVSQSSNSKNHPAYLVHPCSFEFDNSEDNRSHRRFAVVSPCEASLQPTLPSCISWLNKTVYGQNVRS
jgi:hypothetical protein